MRRSHIWLYMRDVTVYMRPDSFIWDVARVVATNYISLSCLCWIVHSYSSYETWLPHMRRRKSNRHELYIIVRSLFVYESWTRPLTHVGRRSRSHVWLDSFMFVSRRMKWEFAALRWYVICGSDSHAWQYLWMTALVRMCDMISSYVCHAGRHEGARRCAGVQRVVLTHVCDSTQVWQYWFTCVTWLVCMCVTQDDIGLHSAALVCNVWYWRMCVTVRMLTVLVHMCDNTCLYVCHTGRYRGARRCAGVQYVVLTHVCDSARTCDSTGSHVWLDLFVCVSHRTM